jgi:hypothetical protein
MVRKISGPRSRCDHTEGSEKSERTVGKSLSLTIYAWRSECQQTGRKRNLPAPLAGLFPLDDLQAQLLHFISISIDPDLGDPVQGGLPVGSEDKGKDLGNGGIEPCARFQ